MLVVFLFFAFRKITSRFQKSGYDVCGVLNVRTLDYQLYFSTLIHWKLRKILSFGILSSESRYFDIAEIDSVYLYLIHAENYPYRHGLFLRGN